MRYVMLIGVVLTMCTLPACTVVRVVDAAASTTIGVTKAAVKGTAKVAGTAVDVVTPDGDDQKDDD